MGAAQLVQEVTIVDLAIEIAVRWSDARGDCPVAPDGYTMGTLCTADLPLGLAEHLARFIYGALCCGSLAMKIGVALVMRHDGLGKFWEVEVC